MKLPYKVRCSTFKCIIALNVRLAQCCSVFRYYSILFINYPVVLRSVTKYSISTHPEKPEMDLHSGTEPLYSGSGFLRKLRRFLLILYVVWSFFRVDHLIIPFSSPSFGDFHMLFHLLRNHFLISERDPRWKSFCLLPGIHQTLIQLIVKRPKTAETLAGYH